MLDRFAPLLEVITQTITRNTTFLNSNQRNKMVTMSGDRIDSKEDINVVTVLERQDTDDLVKADKVIVDEDAYTEKEYAKLVRKIDL